MGEALWGNLISAGGVLIAALMGYLAAAGTEERRARHRRAEQERTSAAAKATEAANRRRTALRELWAHALEARWLMLAEVERQPAAAASGARAAAAGAGCSRGFGRARPAAAAGQAYAAALLALAGARPCARMFYLATVELQLALEAGNDERAARAGAAWQRAFDALEQKAAELADAAE